MFTGQEIINKAELPIEMHTMVIDHAIIASPYALCADPDMLICSFCPPSPPLIYSNRLPGMLQTLRDISTGQSYLVTWNIL